MSKLKKVNEILHSGMPWADADDMVEIFGEKFEESILRIPDRIPMLLFKDGAKHYYIEYRRNRTPGGRTLFVFIKCSPVTTDDLKLFIKQADYYNTQLKMLKSVLNNKNYRVKVELIERK